MNLETWLKQNRPQNEQMGIIEALCIALNEAHLRGVVHPAIEPSNIDLPSDGRVNLAEAVHGVASATGARYRAPEVAEGGSHSAPADIYAAGVIFYEMLAGRPPAAGAERVAPLSDIRPDLSRDLTDAVMGCLEKGPDWRPRDLSYLLQVVAQVRGSTPSRPTAPRPVRTDTPATGTPKAAVAKTAPRSRASSDLPLSSTRDTGGRSSLPMILVAVVVLAGGGVGAWFWLQSQPSTPSAAGKTRPSVTPPPVAAATPTPSSSPTPGGVAAAPQMPAVTAPSKAPTPPPAGSPASTPTALAAATPTPTAIAAGIPPPTTLPARPTPTPAPTSVTAPEPVQPAAQQPTTTSTRPAAVVEPAALTAVTPLTLKRGAQAMIDIRGTALRSDHQLQIALVKERGVTIPIRRVKWVDPTLMKVLVEMDPNLPPGQYTVTLVDPQGNATNALLITITK